MQETVNFLNLLSKQVQYPVKWNILVAVEEQKPIGIGLVLARECPVGQKIFFISRTRWKMRREKVKVLYMSIKEDFWVKR